MDMADNQDKKLIIDDDWKKEAQKEKEVLAEKEQAEEKGHGGRQGPLPEADFPTLVSMLATQAFFALGLLQIKGEPKAAPDLEAAKYNIDILSMLEEKTKGNLQPEEAKLLEDTLYNLRMAFVQLSKA
jgi:hypothetical protein